jgi:hypothetical protein
MLATSLTANIILYEGDTIYFYSSGTNFGVASVFVNEFDDTSKLKRYLTLGDATFTVPTNKIWRMAEFNGGVINTPINDTLYILAHNTNTYTISTWFVPNGSSQDDSTRTQIGGSGGGTSYNVFNGGTVGQMATMYEGDSIIVDVNDNNKLSMLLVYEDDA